MTRARWVGVATVVAGIGFGVLGGEYSTFDWLALRRSIAEEQLAIDRFQIEVDSLTAEADLIETDPVTQERVAREEFGMLRPGEKIFRFQ